jgi:hypothetical protein
VGAVLLALSLTMAVGSAGAVQADEEEPDGPVTTAPGATNLLQNLLNGLLGGDVLKEVSKLVGRDGKTYTLTNHLDRSLIPDLLGPLGLGGDPKPSATVEADDRREYLVVWAGDNNILDRTGADLTALPAEILQGQIGQKDLIGPDFFAVIDATKGSPSYGEVVNTATVGPLVENEPHHMQYIWHKGHNIFAGGLFTDVTYVVDTSELPKLKLKAINLPTDTLCGSVPDAYWTTDDGKAYGTYMGGPDVPGPCVYSDGSVRLGNGFAGSPGEVVRLDENGRTLWEAPATPSTGETEQRCDSIPQIGPATCANPHGIQARPDLDTLVTSDYNEPRNIILNPIPPLSSYLRRPTVRTWDISEPDKPKLRTVSFLPDGPREGRVAHHEEPRAAMETTVTNLPGHKGAFVSTMQGGAIYYSPDITAEKPEWREVFDLTTSNAIADPDRDPYGGGSNGGWLQTSLDDRYLYHAVMGRQASGNDPGSPPYILVLDIRELLASGGDPQCKIDTIEETTKGGAESDCPAVVDTLPARGGPHWGALDNLELGEDGYFHETTDVDRIAYSNYFVARTGLNGDHRVCIADQAEDGTLSLDKEFADEVTGETCLDFDRAAWPHGKWGPAKPHSMLFVTADRDIK